MLCSTKTVAPEDQGTTELENSRTACIKTYQKSLIFNPRWCSMVQMLTDIQTRYILTADRVNLWELFCLCNAMSFILVCLNILKANNVGSKQLIHALGSFLSDSCIAVQLQSNTSDRCIDRTWRWRQILWNFGLLVNHHVTGLPKKFIQHYWLWKFLILHNWSIFIPTSLTTRAEQFINLLTSR